MISLNVSNRTDPGLYQKSSSRCGVLEWFMKDHGLAVKVADESRALEFWIFSYRT